MNESLVTAFTAGAASTFAPCAYPLLPGYVGYYVANADDEDPMSGALVRSVAAGVGVLAVFALAALVLSTLGRQALDALTVAEPVVGVALVVVGVALLSGRVDVHVALPKRRRSVAGFAVFGAGYAVAAAGCLLPVFVAVLGQSLAQPAGVAALSVGAYGTGMALPLVGVTLLAGAGYDVGTDTLPRVAEHANRVAGVLVVAAGVWHLAAVAGVVA
ncbi:cytochrome C biogenesis protein [Haloarchaeobius sp. HRN-SO-5]|uniref:cytochrome C biogenesis protein n=1 Tax=Haloarchaeobius sp. HRN-SO-5 TaxID=3446118 RepID=UPI003EBDB5CF